MLSLPFSLVGGLWLMWLVGFNLSVAVAVGFIAAPAALWWLHDVR
jgi:Cu(I)/Ag(I) efflux system membrane protein CusA/SilA